VGKLKLASFFKNLTAKQKQRVKIAAVIGSACLLIIVSVSITGKKDATKKEEAVRRDRRYTILSDKAEKDLWIAAEAQNIKALEKSNEDMRAEMDKMRKELDTTKQQVKMPPKPVPEKSATAAGVPPKGGVAKPGAQPAQPDATWPPVPPPAPPGTTAISHPPSTKQSTSAKDKDQTGGAGSIRVWQTDQKQSTLKDKAKDDKSHVWVPTGSITKAVILSGMDVPSSLKAKNEPYPALMMLSDYSLLPNRFRMDMKECFIIGAGYGNMVEERAYIRTETLSCIKHDGTPWEVSLKGQVVGEDGKLGMRGNVVTKQGKQIALSIVTGILSGLSTALKPTSPMQFVQLDKEDNKTRMVMPEFGDVMLGAGMVGTGNALAKVSDYYLKLAEQMYPVIEIEAGREVEIIVVKGGKLTPQENKKQEKEKQETTTPTKSPSPKKG